VKIAIATDRDTSKGIAAVLQKHGYDTPSKTVIALAEIVAEKCLTLEKCRVMLGELHKYETEIWWSRAAADTTDEVRKQMAKILVAQGLPEEAAAVRKRETVGDPMLTRQTGHETGGDPRPPPLPGK
jgi:hypothetical protein